MGHFPGAVQTGVSTVVQPSRIQERSSSVPDGIGPFLQAIPDLELWLRGKTVAVHGSIDAEQLEAIRHSCADLWPIEDALLEADVAMSTSALSTSRIDTLAGHIRVGGVVLAVDEYTISMSRARFESLVAPTALEIVRYILPHMLPFLSRRRRPVSCILRRRN